MKKIFLSLFVLTLVFSFVGVGTVSAACDEITPCGNGPIVAQQPGGRFLKAGEEDCPWWFPQMFGHACYTFRAVGMPYVK